MSNTILQQYLTLQFIPIDDELGVEKLNKAIEALVKKLKKDRQRIAQFTLIALDPNCSPDDPVLKEVQEIIIEKWPVFINKAGGNNLVTYNRSVILQSLSELCTDNVEIAGIVWLTGNSIIKHYSKGREEEILKSWLKEIGIKYESEARNLWTISDLKVAAKFPKASSNEVKLDTHTANKSYLQGRLHAAAGPNKMKENGVNEANDNANRYWPQSNANWVTDFGYIAAEAISGSINAVFKANNKELTEYLTQSHENINEFLDQLKPYIESVSNSMLNKSLSLDLRSQLLWLKESMYSSSLDGSYREVDSGLLPFVIANDVAKIIPKLYPTSVDYFAKEIARASAPDIDSDKPILDLIEAGEKNDLAKRIISIDYEYIGRMTLYAFIAGCYSGKYKKEELKQHTGIDHDRAVSKTELLVWLLHDIQAIKLSTSK